MKSNWKKVGLCIAGLSFLASCEQTNEKKDQDLAEQANPGIETQYMDMNVSPKEDFFRYVNGTWLNETEIPDDRTSWGGFQILRQETDKNVLQLLEEGRKNQDFKEGSDQAKAIFLFDAIMDTEARNKAGLAPLMPLMKKIEEISNVEDLQNLKGKYPSQLSTPFFSISAYADPEDSNMNVAYLGTGSLGLPERDYYTNEDEESEEIRQKYVKHVSKMLQFLGDSEAEAQEQAEKILAMETKLAAPRLTKVERRDFNNYNNRFQIDEVKDVTPSIDWVKYAKDLGIEDQLDVVLVMEPNYMKELEKFFQETSIQDIKSLLRWANLRSAASQLTTELDRANWEFYSKELSGAQEQLPLDERALSVVNGSIGEAVGKIYVEKMFPPEAKADAEQMIDNVILAFQKRIENLEWMTEDTKEKAIEKLDKFTVKVGYPDEFKDYSDLQVSADQSYFENMQAVRAWNYQDSLDEIGEPVDKSKWGMSPQTVNAYFNPMMNEIVFPAAILQPPFYNYEADAAVNYGGIGAVIGHEISHAFDDSGARFDADGNLKNWWTDEDLENFTARGEKLADMYSAIEVAEGHFVDGKFTLGENIGDLGGVLGAYDGLMIHFNNNERPENIDGFTPEQRFFMSWATVWRTKIREEALKTQVKTDPHSPGEYRAYVPLQNIDAFYEAFDIVEGDPMYLAPENRVRIW